MLRNIFILLFLSAALAQEESSRQLNQYKEECKREFDIPLVSNHHKRESIHEVPEDKICYYKCIARKLDMMTDEGDLTPQAFKVKIRSIGGPERLIEGIEKCDELKKSDPCRTAEAIYNCLRPY